MNENRTIRVAATVNAGYPYVVLNKSTGDWNGILIDLLRAVCKRLAYQCVIFSYPDPGNQKDFDETLLDLMRNGTADVSVSSVGINAQRFQNFSFISSAFRRTYVAVIHADHLISVEPSEYIFHILGTLFQTPVWIFIGFVFFAVVSLGVCFDIFGNNQSVVCSAKFLLKSLTNWVFHMLGSGLAVQGIEDRGIISTAASSRPSKTVFWLTWHIYTFFILVALGSSLPSMFTFGYVRQKLPFTNVKQLLDSDFTIYGGSVVISTLEVSLVAHYPDLAKRMSILPYATFNETAFERHVKLAQSQRSVLIISLDALMQISSFNCKMIVAIDDLVSVPMASMMFAKNSALQPLFGYGYSSITEIGYEELITQNLKRFLAKAERTSWSNGSWTNSCFRQKITTHVGLQEYVIHLESLQFLFLFFGGSICVSLGVIASELIFFRLKICSKTKSKFEPRDFTTRSKLASRSLKKTERSD